MNHDPQQDILLFAHDNGIHPSLARTQSNVRAVCWWPQMRVSIESHYNSCAYCLAAKTATSVVGDAVNGKHRFRLVEVDHKIPDPVVAKATDCAVLLTRLSQVLKAC